MTKKLVILFFMLVVINFSFAVEYVGTAGDDGTGDGTFGNPWKTWGKGYLEAVDDETVRILTGAYLAEDETVTTDYVLINSNKDVTFQGWLANDSGADVAANVTFTGKNAIGRAIRINTGALLSTLTFKNLTIIADPSEPALNLTYSTSNEGQRPHLVLVDAAVECSTLSFGVSMQVDFGVTDPIWTFTAIRTTFTATGNAIPVSLTEYDTMILTDCDFVSESSCIVIGHDTNFGDCRNTIISGGTYNSTNAGTAAWVFEGGSDVAPRIDNAIIQFQFTGNTIGTAVGNTHSTNGIRMPYFADLCFVNNNNIYITKAADAQGGIFIGADADTNANPLGQVIVTNNLIEYTGTEAGHGMLFGAGVDYGECANNTILGKSIDASLAIGIAIKGEGNDVHNNIVKMRRCIYLKGGARNKIINNTCKALTGGWAFQWVISTDSPDKNYIINNIFDGSDGNYAVYISNGEGGNNFMDYNCLVAGSLGLVYDLENTNTFANIDELRTQWSVLSGDPPRQTDWSNLHIYTANATNSIEADPEFVDAANDDFNLLSGSPCLYSGDPTNVSIGAVQSFIAVPTPAEIATAVWEKDISSIVAADSAGDQLNDTRTDVVAILDDTDEIGTAGAGLTEVSLSSAGNAAITDDWETQSQADPTGFHINVQEWISNVVTVNENDLPDVNAERIDATVATQITDNWEVQSQADPTGFHVNLLEMIDEPVPVIALSDFAEFGYRVDLNQIVGVFETVNADVVALSGDAAAADNQESTYDGTGYTDDNAPAKQIQVSGITNSGAPSNEHAISAPDGFTIINGLNELNTEDDTHADNGTLHSLDNDGANILDCYYIFDIGGAFTPSDVIWRGRAFGNNDDLTVSINTGTIASPSWQERSLVSGSNSSVIIAHTFTLFINDTMTGIDAGKVALRFNGTGLSSATLYTDQIICQKTPKTDNTGYAGGQIWYNSSASNTNTVPDVDGTARNPVSTWAAALTLSGSLNITDFHIINGSTVQLTNDSSNFSLFGDNWTLDLNGQIITSSHFSGASNVSGISTGTGYDFHDSSIMDASFEAGDFIGCVFSGDIILTTAGTYLFKDCASHVAGITTPSMDFENANENKEVNIRGYKGGWEFKNFGHGTATHRCSLEGKGQYILNANCTNADADDVFAIRGLFDDTDNVGVGWGGTISNDAQFNSVSLIDGTWDEVLSVGSHDVNNSSGKRVRQLQTQVYELGAVWVDTVNGSPGTVIFENGTVGSPCDSIADARDIADTLNLKRFMIVDGSSITLAQSFNGFSFFGHGWAIALGGQSISSTYIHGADVSGIGTGASSPHFDHCYIQTVSLSSGMFQECGINGPFTITGAADYFFAACHSMVAGTSAPVLDFGAGVGNSGVNFRMYSGGIDIRNMGDAGTDNMSLEGFGQLILNANCDGGTIAVRGSFTVTDNSGNVTLSDNARYDIAQIDDTITANSIILDIPNTSEFEARTLVSSDYFDAGADTVANVTLVNTTTNNTDMRGTNSALLAGDINLSAGVVESNLLQMNGVTTPVNNLVTFTTSMLDLVNNWVLCDIKALDGDAIQQTDGKVHSIPVGL